MNNLSSNNQKDLTEIANRTLIAMQRTVPPAVGGIAFCSNPVDNLSVPINV